MPSLFFFRILFIKTNTQKYNSKKYRLPNTSLDNNGIESHGNYTLNGIKQKMYMNWTKRIKWKKRNTKRELKLWFGIKSNITKYNEISYHYLPECRLHIFNCFFFGINLCELRIVNQSQAHIQKSIVFANFHLLFLYFVLFHSVFLMISRYLFCCCGCSRSYPYSYSDCFKFIYFVNLFVK